MTIDPIHLLLTSDPAGFLEYGALGLAGLMFVSFLGFATWVIKSMLDIQRRTITAMDRLAEALRTRPCLHDDRILHNDTFHLNP